MVGLRNICNDGGVTLGGWLTVANSLIAEATARTGVDYVCIDTQHGAINASDAVPMIQAILLAGSRPIVRVPSHDPSSIESALDAGAHAVIVPMINSAADAEAAVSAGRYSPLGKRSWGPSNAAMRIDGDYFEWAREQVMVIPMIETAEALENIDAILAVDGVDAIYVGPADLSITLGLRPGNNDQSPAFTDALNRITERCALAGVAAGIHASGELAAQRQAMGFTMLTVTTDMVAMKRAMADEVAQART